MKYFSLIIFFFILYFTWNYAHQNSNVPESAHIGIQNDLKHIITNYIKENLPSAKNLKFEKFWSERLKKDQVKVSFLYSFEDSDQQSGESKVEIEGSAILNRDKSEKKLEDPQFDYWNLDELYILNNKVDFKEPLQINLDSTKLSK